MHPYTAQLLAQERINDMLRDAGRLHPVAAGNDARARSGGFRAVVALVIVRRLVRGRRPLSARAAD
jgi:hypothetical protein